MVEAVMEGIAVTGLDGTVTEANEKAVQMFGCRSEDELLGKNALDLIAQRDCRRAAADMQEVRKQGVVRYIDCALVKADGSEYPGEIRASMKRDASGHPVGLIEIIRDATERRQAEEELRKHREHLEEVVQERSAELTKANQRLQREITERKLMQERLIVSERLATLGQFSGSISHELRNSLATIGSSAYYLKTKLKDANEKVQEHLQRIKSSVDNATTIIQSLLNLTRMREPKLARLDLRAITPEAIALAKVPVAVRVIRDFPEQEVGVHADPEQLSMAFKNIVDNAVEAMEGRGTLTVIVRSAADGWAEVSFADSGPGISPENQDRIFEPLFSTKAKGIGFGLSIARMVIDRHGGTIEARSEPGKGATIAIWLPLDMGERKGE